ncbi:hypothetical protein EV2_014435 [Malus domestica]
MSIASRVVKSYIFPFGNCYGQRNIPPDPPPPLKSASEISSSSSASNYAARANLIGNRIEIGLEEGGGGRRDEKVLCFWTFFSLLELDPLK